MVRFPTIEDAMKLTRITVPLCSDFGGDNSRTTTTSEPGAEGRRYPDEGGAARHGHARARS